MTCFRYRLMIATQVNDGAAAAAAFEEESHHFFPPPVLLSTTNTNTKPHSPTTKRTASHQKSLGAWESLSQLQLHLLLLLCYNLFNRVVDCGEGLKPDLTMVFWSFNLCS